MRINCYRCGESVSSEVPDGTVVRAWIECPECIEKGIKEAPPAPRCPESSPLPFAVHPKYSTDVVDAKGVTLFTVVSSGTGLDDRNLAAFIVAAANAQEKEKPE